MARVLSILGTLAFVGALAILEFAPDQEGIGLALLILSVVLGLGLGLRRVFAGFRAVARQVREFRREDAEAADGRVGSGPPRSGA